MRDLIGQILLELGWRLTRRRRWVGPYHAQDANGEVWAVWLPGWDACDQDPDDDQCELRRVLDAIDRHRPFTMPPGWRCEPFGWWDGTDEIQY